MFEIIGYWFAVSFSTVVMLYTPVFFGSYLVACLIKASIPDKEDGKAYVSFKSYDERAVGSRLKPLSQEKVLFEYESVRKQIITYKEK